MSKRTDPHRPGAIIPAHYEPVLAYNCATSQDGWPVPSYGITCALDGRVTLADGTVKNGECREHGDCCCVAAQNRAHADGKTVYGNPGKCGSCGAWFVYGELWRHTLTGDLVHLGHDCAQKYELMMDRSAAELANQRNRAAVATQIRKAERAEDRAAFLAAHEGLAAAFEVGDASSPSRGAQIIADIANRFTQFCNLSDKQIALVMKLADEIRNPKPLTPEDIPAPAPFGKGVTFEGVIVSAKLRPSFDDTCTWKIVVKVTTEAGSWKAWGTAPATILRTAVAIAEHVSPRGDRAEAIARALRGQRVEIKATLERPRAIDADACETDAEREIAKRKNAETHFAFMSRPTGAIVTYSHPVKSAKRIKAEAAFEKLVNEERQAIGERDRERGDWRWRIITDREATLSLAMTKGVTRSAMIAATVHPARTRPARRATGMAATAAAA